MRTDLKGTWRQYASEAAGILCLVNLPQNMGNGNSNEEKPKEIKIK